MSIRYGNILGMVLLAFLLSACSTTREKNNVDTPGQGVAEVPALDVGVTMFDTAMATPASDADAGDPVTTAESRYVPYLLVETLKRYGNWGIVRLLPDNAGPLDIMVKGTILRSNGETMEIQISVSDSSGRQWYTRTYESTINLAGYDPERQQNNDPFQVIYNNIANDLLAYSQRHISNDQVADIRTVSEILFAQQYLPQAFEGYLAMDKNEDYRVVSRPAEDDPLLLRIRDIRERDFIFIDTLQDYFASYARQIRPHYDSWRIERFHETRTAREPGEDTAKRRFITGTAAVIGGLATSENRGDKTKQSAPSAGIGDDATLIKSGFDKQADARMHMAELEKIGQSFENDVSMREIKLGNNTFALSGTIEEQYGQWQGILAGIYAPEVKKPETEKE